MIVAASLGNALEFYEILVYGYFAVTVSKVFFPAINPAVSMLVTLGTVGISYLSRPRPGSLSVLIVVVCWMTLLKSCYSGTLPSFMAKIFPAATRVSGLSLSYNAAVTIFGGFAPFFAQTLVELTDSKLAPSYYIMVTALLSLISLFILRGRIEPLPIAKRESL